MGELGRAFEYVTHLRMSSNHNNGQPLGKPGMHHILYYETKCQILEKEPHTGNESKGREGGRELTHLEHGNSLQDARYVIPSSVLTAGSHSSGLAKGISASFMDLVCSSQGSYFKCFLGSPSTDGKGKSSRRERSRW